MLHIYCIINRKSDLESLNLIIFCFIKKSNFLRVFINLEFKKCLEHDLVDINVYFKDNCSKKRLKNLLFYFSISF